MQEPRAFGDVVQVAVGLVYVYSSHDGSPLVHVRALALLVLLAESSVAVGADIPPFTNLERAVHCA